MTKEEMQTIVEMIHANNKSLLEQMAAAKSKGRKPKKQASSMTEEAVCDWMISHNLPLQCRGIYTDRQGKKKIHVFLYTTLPAINDLEAELEELGFIESAFTRNEILHNAIHGWAINLASDMDTIKEAE